jgi:hypothetical protein
MRAFFKWLAEFMGKNIGWTPQNVIIGQMYELRPLPMGRDDFFIWTDRILSGAMLPCDPNQDKEIFEDSLRYVLANMLLHLGPTESHKPDIFFIHSLRKAAVNQVADALRRELFEKGKSRLAQTESCEDQTCLEDHNA